MKGGWYLFKYLLSNIQWNTRLSKDCSDCYKSLAAVSVLVSDQVIPKFFFVFAFLFYLGEK